MPPERDYSGTPLPRKLGIKPGTTLALLDAPDGFAGMLQPLPPGVRVVTRAQGELDVVVLFVTRRGRLAERFPAAAARLAPDGGLWIAWPKKSSRVATDLDFDVVQSTGLDAGLVDNKVCAIDATWTALRFVVRLADRPARAQRG
jgi:hypothetical protein